MDKVWKTDRKKETNATFKKEGGSQQPSAVEAEGSYIRVVSFPPCTQEALYTDMSLSEVSDPNPTFPTKNPTLTTSIYICVIILYKLHCSLNNLQAIQCWPGATEVSLRTARSGPAGGIWAPDSLGLCSRSLSWSALCKPHRRLCTPALWTDGKSAPCTHR